MRFSSFWLSYATGLGITLSYHRNLAHRSFTLPKFLEYLFAYIAVLSAEVSTILICYFLFTYIYMNVSLHEFMVRVL